MRLPDAVAPYASLLKVALLVTLVLGARVEGCVAGKAKNANTIAALNAQVRSLNDSLNEFVGLYDRTTAQTRDNAAAAKVIQDAAVELVIRTASERTAAAKAISKLEAELQAERKRCVDGERPICGVKLR